jgi:uncharacterized membrane protein
VDVASPFPPADHAAEPLAALAGPLGWATAAVDVAAVAILILAALRFLARFVATEAGPRHDRARALDAARVELGGYILAALEVLIVSDVIRTAVRFALEDIAFLGALVLVRSLISFFLTREIEAVDRMARPRPSPPAPET